MTLFSVRLIVRSETRAVEQIIESLGLEPDGVARKGDRVSPSSQAIRKASTVTFCALSEEQSVDRLGEYLLELVPPLKRLAGLPPESELDAWVSIGVSGRDMGNVLCFEPSFLELVSKARAQLSVDTYNSV